jgi:hypothetical protein
MNGAKPGTVERGLIVITVVALDDHHERHTNDDILLLAGVVSKGEFNPAVRILTISNATPSRSGASHPDDRCASELTGERVTQRLGFSDHVLGPPAAHGPAGRRGELPAGASRHAQRRAAPAHGARPRARTMPAARPDAPPGDDFRMRRPSLGSA